MMPLCNCRNRQCVCSEPTYRHDGLLECGFCEVGDHVSVSAKKRAVAKIVRNERKYGKPLGYLELVNNESS